MFPRKSGPHARDDKESNLLGTGKRERMMSCSRDNVLLAQVKFGRTMSDDPLLFAAQEITSNCYFKNSISHLAHALSNLKEGANFSHF